MILVLPQTQSEQLNKSFFFIEKKKSIFILEKQRGKKGARNETSDCHSFRGGSHFKTLIYFGKTRVVC